MRLNALLSKNRRRISKITSIALFIPYVLGCSQDFSIESLNVEVNGTASMFKATNGSLSSGMGTLSLSCSTAVASLHAVKADGSIDTASLSSANINSAGEFKLSVIEMNKVNLLSRNIQYVVKASGCGSEYCRPLTDTKNQLVNGASTLICMSSDLSDNTKRLMSEVSREEMKSVLDGLSSVTADTLSNLLNTIIADTSLAGKFQEITNVSPAKLKDLPPPSLTVTAPLSVHEMTSNTYQASVEHWNSEYQVGYEWTLNGSVVSQTNSYVYSPAQNSQGPQTLILKVGSRASGGGVDFTKLSKSESFAIQVSDDYPAMPPVLSITSPATSGVPISTRSLTLGINTGASLSQCATFSKLALTENTTTPPAAADFNITCSTANSQSASFTLSSSGDGPKKIRLWAQDSAGNISASSSIVSVDLDTAAPTASITSSLASITNATSQSLTFSANDNGGSIDHFECKIDAGAYTSCSSPKIFSSLSQGSHTASIKAVDTATNASAAVTATWTVDLTEPTLSFSATPNLVTNSLSSSFSFSGSDTGGGSISKYECKLDAGSYSVCTSPKIDVLLSGSHTLLVKAFDTAGNISDVLSYSWTIDAGLPTSTISAKPASITNSQAASFSFSATDIGGGTVASYECSIDAGAFASCSSPKSYSSLSAGTHSFAIRAIDTAGNVGSSASYNWTIDLSTPMASINSGPASITNDTSATFTFNANAPPAGSITGYVCSIDGGAYASCTSPATFSGLTQGNHSFAVKSVDNNSALSAAATEAWVVDTTLPVVSMSTSPSGVVNDTTASLTFSATDTGGGSVASYQCKLNAAAYANCASPVNLSALAEGTQTFLVKAFDSAGNESAPVTVTWTTDLTAPSVSIATNPNSITNQQSASFTFSGTDSGGSSVSGYQCSIDNAAFSACTSPANYASLSAGSHSFAVKASDATGNIGSAQTFSWTIDLAPPTTTISSMPALNAASTSASFSFSGSDTGGGGVASYQCALDNGSYSACTSPRAYTGLAQGNHIFYVRTLDTAGNTGTDASYSWAVDTVVPTISISTPAANGSVVLASAVSSFSFSGSCETGLTVVFSGLSTTNTVCSGGAWSKAFDISAQTEGSLSLTATQTDAAGNSSSVTRTIIKDTTAPTISLTSVPTGVVKGGTTSNIGFTVTEANISTSQSFTVSYSSDNGTTWTSAGTVTSTAGPLSSASFSYTMNLPTLSSAQFKVKVTGSDQAGNAATSSASSAFTVDSTAPVLSSVTINDGAASVSYSFVGMKVSISDNNAGPLSVKFADTSAGGDCQGIYTDSNWTTWTSANTAISYNMSALDGNRKICAWGKDAVGNISEISPTAGTLGVNADTIDYFVGNSPIVTGLTVQNSGGGTTFTLNETVYISWTLTDVEGLSNTPVDIYASVNGAAYTVVAQGVGALTGNPTSGTGSYTGYLAPSGVFRIKIVATDTNGNTSIPAVSNIVNSSNWSVYLASSERGVGGKGTSVSMSKYAYGVAGNQFAMNPINGDIYAVSYQYGIYKLDAQTGKTSIFMPHGTHNFSAGRSLTGLQGDTYNIAINFDKAGRLYISNPEGLSNSTTSSVKIWQLDFANDKVNLYLGGGTSPGTSATMPTATSAFVGLGAYDIDDNGSLYFFSDCDPSVFVSGSLTLKHRLLKLTQNADGTAGTISLVAGDCSASVTNNVASTSTGLGTTRYRHIRHIAVNGDGSLIYVGDNDVSPPVIKFYDATGTGSYKTYTTALSSAGLAFDRQHNRLYTGNGVVSKVTLAADPAAAETSSVIATTNGTGDCNSDGVVATSACINAYGSNGPAPLEIANDGTLLFTDSNFRIRYIDANNQLRTLMGARAFYGAGLNRLLARGNIKGIYYKTSNNNTADYPKGLYFVDSTAGVLGYVNPSTDIVSVLVGNQQMYSGSGFPADGSVVSENSNMGTFGNNNFMGLTFNSDGLPIFFAHSRTVRLEPGKVLKYLTTDSGSYWYHGTDNTSLSSLRFFSSWGEQNFIAVGLNYIFGLGVNNASSRGAFSSSVGFIDLVNSKYRVLMKGTSASGQAAAADSSVPATVNATALSGAGYAATAYVQYNSTDQQLYFSEGNYIRTLTSPTDPSAVTLSTPAALSMGRNVYNFAFSPDNNRVYYISNDGKLYCKWIGVAATPTNCNNTSLGPPTGFTTLTKLPNQMTFIEDGKLLISNVTEVYQYTYTP